ncbi:NAD(P)/FAD-dependent oxidoreductase [Streptomyces sp. NBC_00690]|uniref:NAD(P)/FAD-dependent oxidoreductase n=1 Tax=Streptomyces sp. NBC_00690 TaxID=2975808 RepID=UPI002E2894F4|nr:FAD-dependent oxidoreductase [Streptomyces sp. NBC_00690]
MVRDRVRHVTIVGASAAGLAAAHGLRQHGFDGPVTVFGDEPEAAYQRPALSKRFLTSADLAADSIRMHTGLEDVRLELGVRATGLDLDARRLHLRASDGDRTHVHRVDALVIATGAAARRLPIRTPPGVHVLRTLADAAALRADLVGLPRVAIVGAGFVGSEVASSCRALGLDVTLIEAGPAPMARVLGPGVGTMLAALHRDHGTRLRLGAGVAGFTGRDRVTGVQLASGEVVPADVVVVGVGARPATDWLENSGLPLDDGVVCGADLSVADRIVAAGDVARWPHHRDGALVRVEHWDNALRQANTAAATLLALDDRPATVFSDTTMFWSDQYDCKLQLVGHPYPDDLVTVVEGDLAQRRGVVVYSRAGQMTAALLVSSPHRLRDYRRAVASGDPVPLPAATP